MDLQEKSEVEQKVEVIFKEKSEAEGKAKKEMKEKDKVEQWVHHIQMVVQKLYR